jgi:hypothetical protein
MVEKYGVRGDKRYFEKKGQKQLLCILRGKRKEERVKKKREEERKREVKQVGM